MEVGTLASRFVSRPRAAVASLLEVSRSRLSLSAVAAASRRTQQRKQLPLQPGKRLHSTLPPQPHPTSTFPDLPWPSLSLDRSLAVAQAALVTSPPVPLHPSCCLQASSKPAPKQFPPQKGSPLTTPRDSSPSAPKLSHHPLATNSWRHLLPKRRKPAARPTKSPSCSFARSFNPYFSRAPFFPRLSAPSSRL